MSKAEIDAKLMKKLLKRGQITEVWIDEAADVAPVDGAGKPLAVLRPGFQPRLSTLAVCVRFVNANPRLRDPFASARRAG